MGKVADDDDRARCTFLEAQDRRRTLAAEIQTVALRPMSLRGGLSLVAGDRGRDRADRS
jgi:hypothetical protein